MRLLFHVICMSALLLTLPAASASPLRVAVAANFATTARSLGSTFEAASGQRVEFSVASTGVTMIPSDTLTVKQFSPTSPFAGVPDSAPAALTHNQAGPLTLA